MEYTRHTDSDPADRQSVAAANAQPGRKRKTETTTFEDRSASGIAQRKLIAGIQSHPNPLSRKSPLSVSRPIPDQPIQGRFLDASKPSEVWGQEYEKDKVTDVPVPLKINSKALRISISRYEGATSIVEAKKSLDQLVNLAKEWKTSYAGQLNSFDGAVEELHTEANQLSTLPWNEWISLEEQILPLYNLEPGQVDVNVIGQLKDRTSNSKVQIEGNKLVGFVLKYRGLVAKHFNYYYEDSRRIAAEFGTREDIHGQSRFIPNEEKSELTKYIEDYNRILRLLSNRKEVESLLAPLNLALKERKWKLARIGKSSYELLKELLLENETRYGFTPVRLIPLGVLPAENFLDIISRGIPFEDIGAGVGHGPLSHRLQWYAITHKYGMELDQWHFTPIELYKKLGKDPFTKGNLTGTALWAILGDQPNEGGNYRHPMELNKTLMGKPNFQTGQKARPGKTDMPDLQSALLKKANEAWLQYPSGRGDTDEPTQEMVAEYEASYTSRRGGYEVLEKGEAEYSGEKRPFSTLIHHDDREEYEKAGK